MADHVSTSFLPLFDRLTTPGQAPARHYVDGTLFYQSVQHELQRLLSCRSRLPLDRFLAEAADVLDYGIPDSTALTMASVDDRARLAKAIQRAITVFEPRLRDVTVDIAPGPENGMDALVYINAARQGAPGARRAAFAMTTRGQLHGGSIDAGYGRHAVHGVPGGIDAARVEHDRHATPRLSHQEPRDA